MTTMNVMPRTAPVRAVLPLAVFEGITFNAVDIRAVLEGCGKVVVTGRGAESKIVGLPVLQEMRLRELKTHPISFS
jgi:hypothetical protein